MRHPVAGVAEQDEVVDVGGATSLPLVGVMGLAPVDACATLPAAPVGGDECHPLISAGQAGGAPEPQGLTGAVEHMAKNPGGRSQFDEYMLGNRRAVDQFSSAGGELVDDVDEVSWM